jgi:hypothetical protein
VATPLHTRDDIQQAFEDWRSEHPMHRVSLTFTSDGDAVFEPAA